MKAYSLDLRQRIVQAVEEGGTAEEAASLYDVSPATVRRYRRQQRLEGTLVPKTSSGRRRLIAAADEATLEAQVSERPDWFLEEHCHLWQQRTQQAVSVATMCRALARLRLTRKKRLSTRRNRMRPNAPPGETL